MQLELKLFSIKQKTKPRLLQMHEEARKALEKRMNSNYFERVVIKHLKKDNLVPPGVLTVKKDKMVKKATDSPKPNDSCINHACRTREIRRRKSM